MKGEGKDDDDDASEVKCKFYTTFYRIMKIVCLPMIRRELPTLPELSPGQEVVRRGAFCPLEHVPNIGHDILRVSIGTDITWTECVEEVFATLQRITTLVEGFGVLVRRVRV